MSEDIEVIKRNLNLTPDEYNSEEEVPFLKPSWAYLQKSPLRPKDQLQEALQILRSNAQLSPKGTTQESNDKPVQGLDGSLDEDVKKCEVALQKRGAELENAQENLSQAVLSVRHARIRLDVAKKREDSTKKYYDETLKAVC